VYEVREMVSSPNSKGEMMSNPHFEITTGVVTTNGNFTIASGYAHDLARQREIELKKKLDAALAEDITHPCSYHPAGRNHLLLNPQEREEIIKRVLKIMEGR
jgi:hypothetical protein